MKVLWEKCEAYSMEYYNCTKNWVTPPTAPKTGKHVAKNGTVKTGDVKNFLHKNLPKRAHADVSFPNISGIPSKQGYAREWTPEQDMNFQRNFRPHPVVHF
jgi:hypothetical protein